MVDPWIEKAWRMPRETECLSNVSILKAALSLEKMQNEAPARLRYRSGHFAPLSGARTEKKREGAAYTARALCFSSSNVEAGSNQPAGSGGLSERVASSGFKAKRFYPGGVRQQ